MTKSTLAALLMGVTAALWTPPASAKDAHVIAARAVPTGGGTWRFDVTVKSNDTGWKKYADRWEILDERGTVIATRILHHPHQSEQPFTRSLSGVRLPSGVSRVTIRAHDKVNGYGGRTVKLTVKPRPAN